MRPIETVFRVVSVAAILGSLVARTNGQTNNCRADFRIPLGLFVSRITVTRIEDDTLRTAKSPMRVNWKEQLLLIANRQSIATYIDLTKAIRVIGTTRIDTIEKAQLLGQEPRWLICVDGMYTNISTEQRKKLSDGDISFRGYYRVYGDQLCEHHPQHPDVYLTEGDAVSNLLQFIEGEMVKQKQSESHSKVPEDTARKLADPQH